MMHLQEMLWTTKHDYDALKRLGYGRYSLPCKHFSWAWLVMLHRIGVTTTYRSEHGSLGVFMGARSARIIPIRSGLLLHL